MMVHLVNLDQKYGCIHSVKIRILRSLLTSAELVRLSGQFVPKTNIKPTLIEFQHAGYQKTVYWHADGYGYAGNNMISIKAI